MWHFDVIDLAKILSAFDCKEKVDAIVIPIWTTTPWTLPANEAVSVNPKLDYALLSCKIDKRNRVLVIANELIDEVMNRYQVF